MENFIGNRNDGIPLSGGLRDPQPMIKVGHIEKGADIIFAVPTVKVYLILFIYFKLIWNYIELNYWIYGKISSSISYSYR